MKPINPYLRSTAYRAFASWYRYPEQSSLDTLKAGQREFCGCFEALAAHGNFESAPSIHSLVESLDGVSLTDLQAEYVRLFDYRPLCPLFESSYTEMEKSNPGKVKLSVEDFYNDFDLDTSPCSVEPPDHITLEMEFMHFLSFKEGEESENGGPKGAKYVLGQQQFYRNHLHKWVSAFCNRLTQHAALPFYKILAGLTDNFLMHDSDYIDALCEDLQ